MAWSYENPVRVDFGVGAFARLPQLVKGRRYALVTYDEPFFAGLTQHLKDAAGAPLLTVRDVAPNPDCRRLAEQAARFAALPFRPDVIVALGGGSVIDSAKVFAAAGGDFSRVARFLETGDNADELTAVPVIAVPTTAGTGSEVTCWATLWDTARGRKYSLARPGLYPSHAIVDPRLMLGKPLQLTVSTGLDALSHALESLWNVHANPVSTNHAVRAARCILNVLPRLARRLDDIELRSRMAQAALFAGLAFSNTKTAIAHSLSYPITLRHGVAHGIACSFTLPLVLRAVRGAGGLCAEGLTRIFGADLERGADALEAFLAVLGVSCDPAAYGIAPQQWRAMLGEAMQGERGRNFIASREALIAAAAAYPPSPAGRAISAAVPPSPACHTAVGNPG
jgi:phosphonate metabolism-associated iron-containing alcohol dehydrogenase